MSDGFYGEGWPRTPRQRLAAAAMLALEAVVFLCAIAGICVVFFWAFVL